VPRLPRPCLPLALDLCRCKRDEARRIAVNVAKLPELLGAGDPRPLPNTTVLDLRPLLRNDDGNLRDEFSVDGLHLSPKVMPFGAMQLRLRSRSIANRS
jgi:hypothetical protein